MNWKLLHWEVFKAELDMAGSNSDSQPIDSLEPHGSLTRNKNQNRFSQRQIGTTQYCFRSQVQWK